MSSQVTLNRRRQSWRCLALLALLLCSSAQGSDRWGADYFPNVPLVTHEGKTVRFFDDLIKDKVVLINFIYTTCAESCPLETARLREVHTILGDRVGRDVFMYSITIDPERDTPEVLKNYAKRFRVGGPGWTFLTGKEEDITLLRRKLGLYIEDIQDGSNDHNLSLIMGNQASGRWRKGSPFENPYVLASQLGGWLTNWKTPATGESDYASAPKLRDVSKGETLYRTRCSACHSIGPDDGPVRTGPNLLGVTEKRDRAWLRRWLIEPDKMLAEKDPIAIELFERFNEVPMPNMQLNDKHVDLLLEYLDAENRRLASTAHIEMKVNGTAD